MDYSFSCSKKSTKYNFDLSKRATEYNFRASKKETNYSFTLSKKVVDYDFQATRYLREEKSYRDLEVFEGARAFLRNILRNSGIPLLEYRLPSQGIVNFLTPSGVQFSLRLLPGHETDTAAISELKKSVAINNKLQSEGIFTFWVKGATNYLPNKLIASSLWLALSDENPIKLLFPFQKDSFIVDFCYDSGYGIGVFKAGYLEADKSPVRALKILLLIKALETWGVEKHLSYKQLQSVTGLSAQSLAGLLGSGRESFKYLDKSKKAHRKINDYEAYCEKFYSRFEGKQLSVGSGEIIAVPPPSAITPEGRELAKARAYQYREIKNSWH